MTRNEQNNEQLDIDPSTIILGIAYATTLCVAIGWVATFVA